VRSMGDEGVRRPIAPRRADLDENAKRVIDVSLATGPAWY